MNRLFLLLICFWCTSVNAETAEELARKWLYTIASDDFSGRRSGTEGCRKAFEYIKEQISSMGYFPEVDTFKYEDATFRNIIVPVGNVIDTVIVVGAHYDGQFESSSSKKYPAANDNASGVVTILLLLQEFKDNGINPHYPIFFCFWDGEEDCYGDIFKGSKYYVEHNKNTVLYYINIDTIGHDHDQPNTMSFLYRGEGVSEIIKEMLNNKRFKFKYSEAPKGYGASDHVPFDVKDIPYIGFYDSPASKHKECGHDLHSINDIPEAVSIDKMVTLSELVFQILTK